MVRQIASDSTRAENMFDDLQRFDMNDPTRNTWWIDSTRTDRYYYGYSMVCVPGQYHPFVLYSKSTFFGPNGQVTGGEDIKEAFATFDEVLTATSRGDVTQLLIRMICDARNIPLVESPAPAFWCIAAQEDSDDITLL